ncbi:hypothetical protein F5Y15DRAFT_49449 [Xylariaceae sp. FL0016]|nr:hypothetical protein F5Y15DRAFT_49449 [Xylariaceae sp. FL0016]
MVVAPNKYHVPPTALIPNSPYPLLHYPGLLSDRCAASPNAAAVHCHGLLSANGWQTQWAVRYGATQTSHYHSGTHECMVVLSGAATIRFGVADTVADLELSTNGPGREAGGIEIRAEAGDVFVLPAGLAHKTFHPVPEASLAILTPSDGHSFDGKSAEDTLATIDVSGFTMMGAYPVGSRAWDFAKGGDHVGSFEKVWAVAKPTKDPMLGEAEEGLKGAWV